MCLYYVLTFNTRLWIYSDYTLFWAIPTFTANELSYGFAEGLGL